MLDNVQINKQTVGLNRFCLSINESIPTYSDNILKERQTC